MPELYVIAGPNGVGKTTFMNRYLASKLCGLEFVNADVVARQLCPASPESVSLEAGRMAIHRIRELLHASESFAWETTMSGRTATVWLREAKNSGYQLKCYFLWAHDPQITLSRIRQRVIEGGHNIPDDISERRFFKTIRNFFEIYRELFDAWKLYETDGNELRLIALEKEGRFVLRDRQAMHRITTQANIEL
jgi:predicted ABC-type ATPase